MLIRFIFFIFLSWIPIQAGADVSQYFDSIKNNPTALAIFFREMPKGGELHYHFDGSMSPAELLKQIKSNEYCVDPKTLAVTRKQLKCIGVDAHVFLRDKRQIDQVTRAWSMENFVDQTESKAQHFFRVFSKVAPLYEDFTIPLLTTAIQKAANQHELYMEVIMLHLSEPASYAKLIDSANNWVDKKRILLENRDFQKEIQTQIKISHFYLEKINQALGCDSLKKSNACSVTIRFQFWVNRNASLDDVFVQALMGFAVAGNSADVVGVNLVGAETGAIARHDFDTQMKLFGFLHQLYPDVKIALHAGELAPNMVPRADLRFHIRHSVLLGNANRIGHGVDILHENKSEKTVEYMARKGIPVEINLTSNQVILAATGESHPLLYYMVHRVPLVLSTDDEGILNTDLTQQFVDVVIKYHLDYQAIKQMNRNALTYSFLPGASIWAKDNPQNMVSACSEPSSPDCDIFIQGSQKAKLQWKLEQQLGCFEKKR